MRCKTMLLGGAVALALSGAAYAQTQQASPQATPGTDQINAGAAAGTPSATESTPSTTTKSSTHHRRHHVAHHHHHVHHTKTASGEHAPSTPAEKRATNELNAQQLQGGAMQATSAGGTAGQQGQMNGTGAPATGAQPGSENMPGNATYSQPGAQPGTETNPPSNATYSQPQGSPGVQPQNTSGEPTPGYATAPGANGPVGSQGNPTTSTDQNTTPPPSNPNQPGPSS